MSCKGIHVAECMTVRAVVLLFYGGTQQVSFGTDHNNFLVKSTYELDDITWNHVN